MKILITKKQLQYLINEKLAFNDGGRKESGYRRNVGDCVTRAIAIALGKPYTKVFKDMNNLKKQDVSDSSTASQGMYHSQYTPYLKSNGWNYVKLDKYINFTKEEIDKAGLPKGVLLLRANVRGESSKRSAAAKNRAIANHLVTITNDENEGMIHDTYACNFGGESTIIGYFYNSKVTTLPEKDKEIIAVKTKTKPFYAIVWEYQNSLVFNLRSKFDWKIIQGMANTYPKYKSKITSPIINVYEIQDEDIRFKYKFHRTTSLVKGSYLSTGLLNQYIEKTEPIETIDLDDYSQDYGRERFITKVTSIIRDIPLYFLHTKKNDSSVNRNIKKIYEPNIEVKKVNDSILEDIPDNFFTNYNNDKSENYDLIADIFGE